MRRNIRLFCHRKSAYYHNYWNVTLFLVVPNFLSPLSSRSFLIGKFWPVLCTFFVLILWGMTLCLFLSPCKHLSFLLCQSPRLESFCHYLSHISGLHNMAQNQSTVSEPQASWPVAEPVTSPPPVWKPPAACFLELSFMLCQHAHVPPESCRPCATKITLWTPDATLHCLDFVLFLYYSQATGGHISWYGSCT